MANYSKILIVQGRASKLNITFFTSGCKRLEIFFGVDRWLRRIATGRISMLDIYRFQEADHEPRETEFDHELVTETKKKLKNLPSTKFCCTMTIILPRSSLCRCYNMFSKEHTEAVQIMLHVHKKGIGVAGVYT